MSTDQQPENASTPPLSPRGAARRRLTKAGLGAASILWTVESHATMKPMICFSPSAGFSGKLNSNYTNQVICTGRSHGYWKNHGGWPCDSSQKFHEVFPCNSAKMETYGMATLLQIVQGCDFDSQHIGMELVVAYLNILSGRISFLSERTLGEMWAQLQSKGYYQPATNVFWNAEQTKNYLEATHD